jgi:hypothetical protein
VASRRGGRCLALVWHGRAAHDGADHADITEVHYEWRSPPRFPLIRFHGVLAPRSAWRKEIVPQPREPRPCTPTKQKVCGGKSPDVKVRATDPPAAPVHSSDSKSLPPTPLAMVPAAGPVDTHPPAAGRSLSTSVAALAALAPILLAPSILAVAHWDRLMAGLLYAVSPRLPWSQLLRRTFATDVEQCPKCLGRLRVIQTITEPAVAHAILDRLGMPSDAPIAARARDPTDDEMRDDGG